MLGAELLDCRTPVEMCAALGSCGRAATAIDMPPCLSCALDDVRCGAADGAASS